MKVSLAQVLIDNLVYLEDRDLLLVAERRDLSSIACESKEAMQLINEICRERCILHKLMENTKAALTEHTRSLRDM